jgi:hypothetical protein
MNLPHRLIPESEASRAEVAGVFWDKEYVEENVIQMNALQLAYEASAPGTVSLSLFDAKGGKTFLSRSFEASRGTNHWWIPFRDAPGGVYFVRVRVGSDVYRKRVFIW